MAPVNVLSFCKTRIAPTPSGYLHVGNILSFAITTALAQQYGANIFLRIDDMDRARAGVEYIQDIFDTLTFLNIPYQDGPGNPADFEARYSQVHRMPLYLQALEQLQRNNSVFACICTRKQLLTRPCNCDKLNIDLNTPDAAWRLRTNHDRELQVTDISGKTLSAKLPTDMHNFIVRKKDGFPAYQLTSVVDDIFYGTDMIVRGMDLWPSTLAQLELASALNQHSFQRTVFYHHPLLVNSTGQKLSKSAGATSIHYLRYNGHSAADIYTMIAKMLGSDKPVATWKQLAEIVLATIR